MNDFDPSNAEPRLVTRTDTTPVRKRPRLSTRILGALFPILILAALALAYGARRYVHNALLASLPHLDGTLSVPGLSAPVTVLRDARGVPHIRAANLDDLVLAQGYITAQDRLWQMDGLRRNASGELAEVLGAALLPHDRNQRILQIRATADRALATLPPGQLHYLEQYAKGVNASIETQRPHLPLEFQVLRYSPTPWTPRDSLLIGLTMFQQLSNNFPQKLSREALTAKLPPELLADLYPVGSWRDHPPGQTVDLTMPVDEIEQVPLDESQSSLRNPDLVTPQHAAGILSLLNPCRSCVPGSNNWAISSDHTTTGKPLLANDTHLAHSLPGIWYETDLEAADFHTSGVAIPGTPFIAIGHNAHVAWGFTVFPADTQDLYIEHLRDNEYQSPDGSWHPLAHQSEVIHVRNRPDEILDVQLTRHGTMDTPIITNLIPKEKRSLALRWTIYDPTTIGSPFLEINSATNWTSFSSALAHYAGPPLNLVYADDQNHIAYHAIGRVPLRGTDPAQPQPLAPIPTEANTPDAATHEWSAWIPYDQLPSVVDPPGGIVSTANARTTPDSYTLPITLDWIDPYRNERIWKLLAAKPRFAPSEMLAIQTDVYSDLDHVIAQRLAYAIDHAVDHPNYHADGKDKPRSSIDQKRLRQAADLLRSWNGQVDANSPAAAIVDATRATLWPLLLSPHLGPLTTLYTWGERDYAEEQLIMHTPDRWLPKPFPTWDDLLAAAVEQGFTVFHAPINIAQWKSGTLHPVDVEHPVYSQSSLLQYLVAMPTGTGSHPQSGDTSTVKQVDRTFGPSERLTVDLANPDNTTLNLVLGQSGNPASPNFMDQFQSWLQGTTYPLPFTHQAVTVQHTLTLNPRQTH